MRQKLGKPTHKYIYRAMKVFSNQSVWENMSALSWGNCSHYMCFLVLMERQIEPKLRWPSYLNDPFKMLSVSRLFFYKWVQCYSDSKSSEYMHSSCSVECFMAVCFFSSPVPVHWYLLNCSRFSYFLAFCWLFSVLFVLFCCCIFNWPGHILLLVQVLKSWNCVPVPKQLSLTFCILEFFCSDSRIQWNGSSLQGLWRCCFGISLWCSCLWGLQGEVYFSHLPAGTMPSREKQW